LLTIILVILRVGGLILIVRRLTAGTLILVLLILIFILVVVVVRALRRLLEKLPHFLQLRIVREFFQAFLDLSLGRFFVAKNIFLRAAVGVVRGVLGAQR
jgi:hypothetical protein